MSNLDDLAKFAEEAEAANVHDRPVTDADLGETATEGAQVVIGNDTPAPATTPVNPAMQSLPEMQLPQPVQTPVEQYAVPPAPPVTVQAPASTAAPAPLPPIDKAPQLAPFSDQITHDGASAPAAPAMQITHPGSAPAQTTPAAPAPIAEQPTAPPAAGTMPGQTVSPQTVSTPASHIIPESFPKPVTGVDPLSGITV